MKVSVIIPIYNTQQYLRKCLDSLLNQTLDDFEIIMVDDGSTDNSAEIAKEYERNNGIIFRYVYKENGGQASARNIGINISLGDYLGFVDSDDWVSADYLEKLYLGCINNNAEISMCGIYRIWDNGLKKEFKSGFHKNGVYNNIEAVLTKTSFSPWNKLFKKDLFKGLRFPESMVYEDFAFIPQIIARAQQIYYISDKLYFYYWRAGSTINNNNIRNDQICAIEILEKSELSKYPIVLEVYNIREILCSYIWKMLSIDNKELVKKTINNILKKYSNISQNEYQYELGKIEYYFFKLILARKIRIAKFYIKIVKALRFLNQFFLKLDCNIRIFLRGQ